MTIEMHTRQLSHLKPPCREIDVGDASRKQNDLTLLIIIA